jgi:phosphatidylglycerol---prolipoprotein diacylglyceryl transferase
MPAFYTEIGPLRLQTFTFALGLALVLSLSLGLYRVQAARGAVVDACLGALLLGVAGARAGHVALNWSHFAFHIPEIWQLRAGGLDWHGAVWGGLLGLALATRWRRVAFWPLLDALTPALPLLALAGWWGCAAANCGFGVEVDTLANYPPLIVAELPDVYGIPAPRYNTALLGWLLGLAALLLTIWLLARDRLNGRRFGLVLALLSLGMFGIGGLRADYAIYWQGLRADQWLDGVMLGTGVLLMFLAPSRHGEVV